MTLQTVISLLVVGLLVGVIATLIVKHRTIGLVANIGISVIGAFLGYFVLHQISPALSQLIFAAGGGLLLIWLVGLVKK
ncbi:MAG: hypothetical protein WC661_13865 [Opitutaceae bacterium]|jgi:uncharacterized membrane protein YeaQ/YmgE (transglycosylase-associated protein family)